MKKILLTLLAFLVLSYPALAVEAPVLTIILTTQSPYPVEPGQNVNIEIEIQNSGNIQARNQVVEIVPKAPFTLLPGEDAEKMFSIISAADSVKTSYNLHVDNDAITNQYELGFNIYDAGRSNVYATQKVLISVQGEPELILQDAKISDGVPGGLTNLSVEIMNIGTGTARHLKLNFSSTENIVPLLSKGLIYLGDIGPGGVAKADILLSISSEAEHKTYISTLAANYLDENNEAQSKSFSVGVPVKGSVLLDVIKVEPDYNRERLNIDIANKGTTEAKSLEATLIVDGKVIDIDYTSSLKANKKVTFTFPLVMKGTGTLKVDYIGPGLEENSITESISLNFQPPSQDNTALYAFLVIVIVIVVYYLRKKGKLKIPYKIKPQK